MIEEWRDVPGFEGLYEVSDWGRIRRNGKIRRPTKSRSGYLRVDLWKNGISKMASIHRLVASAFLPNPDNLPQVNHKDEDKTNNTVENLEWCSAEYNVNYGTRNERVSKPVLQFDLQGNFIKEWPGVRTVGEELGIDSSGISKCCLGRTNHKSIGGFIWRHKE